MIKSEIFSVSVVKAQILLAFVFAVATHIVFADSSAPPNPDQWKLVNAYISAMESRDAAKLKSLYHPDAFNCAREKNIGREHNQRFYSSVEIAERLQSQLTEFHETKYADMEVVVQEKVAVDPLKLAFKKSFEGWSDEHIEAWVAGVKSLPLLAHSSKPPTHEIVISLFDSETSVQISTLPVVYENNNWYLTFYCIRHRVGF